MIVIVAFEVAIIWQAYSKRGELEDSIGDKLLKTINESGNKKVYQESWHVLQAEVSLILTAYYLNQLLYFTKLTEYTILL